MQNRVTVTIDGQEYTLVASEDAAYMKKVAAHVDEKLQEVRQGGKVSSTDAAVLAALNMADEYFKSLEAAENLRMQIKESLEESKKLNLELSEAKREIFKLQTQGKKG
ncbi:MAG: cell division protein ZapA [Oscillospiraceae bacterium]|nr:cell division protein ZapA [Oscillospiraceae bacterium]